ncbi:MAG: DUF6675 family protein [Geminicoccales bacterium]
MTRLVTFVRSSALNACLVILFGGLLASPDAKADKSVSLPRPPCDGEPIPAFPGILHAPEVELWLDDRELEMWQPAPCLGWAAKPATVLIATAGRFEHAGTTRSVLARLGAVSTHTSIRYWSVSRQKWRPLLEQSYALSASDVSARRQDFKTDELKTGDQVLVLQDEIGPAREVIQQFTIIHRDDEKVIVDASNVTPSKVLLATLLEAGGSDMHLWLEGDRGQTWSYYSLTRLSGSKLLARSTLRRSYMNRAAALFHFLAATPEKIQVPAAR